MYSLSNVEQWMWYREQSGVETVAMVMYGDDLFRRFDGKNAW